MTVRSIEVHSRNIESPAFLKDPRLIQTGVREYHTMCRLCHGTPGQTPTEITRGLYPRPPYLASEETQKRKDGELLWIVKNGIKMTGMPAFGPTHDEDELWAIVAFARFLPRLADKEYLEMEEKAGRSKEEGHHHGKRKH